MSNEPYRFDALDMHEALSEHCNSLKYEGTCRLRRCLLDAGWTGNGPPIEQGVYSGTCVWLQMAEKLNLS